MQNAVHLYGTVDDHVAMALLKNETLSIRTSSEIKHLLRLAAARERRSVASMIEFSSWNTPVHMVWKQSIKRIR